MWFFGLLREPNITMYSKLQWLKIAHQLQSMAQAGLTYSTNIYDRERYEQLLDITAEIVTEYSSMNMQKVQELFGLEKGYLTPKVDVRGVIFRGDELLLVRELQDGKWSLPGGWADVGYSPSEMVVKEVREEAGLHVKATRLLAVLDKRCHPHPPDIYYVYKLFFLCEEVEGEVKTGIETTDVRFFKASEIPELSIERNTPSQVEQMFQLRHQAAPAVFD
ncbi:MAG: NUDIX hydrolase [Cyclobacteriaceae bacterium]|nr:NUDIX hydrolase [Cyclobacteriaceae bacterium]